MNAGFWFAAGVMTGATATAVSMPLWRGIAATLAARPRAYVIAASGLALFACSAALLYLVIGSPGSLQSRSATLAAHPVGNETASGAKALSMEAATARLEARLQRDGGSANDWQLLAQSYDFVGRSADASRARARAATAAPAKQVAGTSDSRMPSVSDVASQAALLGKQLPSAAVAMQTSAAAGQSTASSVASQPTPTAPGAPEDTATRAQLERQLKLNPRDARAWLELAELHRRSHEADAARVAYEKVVGLRAMTAQSWADYADVLGTRAGGSLAGAAGRAIERSLALDPTNPKALWLDASRAFQEKRYNDALGIWKRLHGVLAPDSPDMPLVEANIAEALQLAQGPASAAADGKPPAGAAPSNTASPRSASAGAGVPTSAGSPAGTGSPAAEISGTVSIEPRLAGRVDRDATLFIYAKAADSPGPPLAVMRLAANGWPVSFRLDDSMAMIPSRRLSQFQKVIVEARISRSGQAAPTAGDLYVTSSVLSPSSGKKLALVINHEIG